MREPERAILVRMVILAVLALLAFSGYAVWRVVLRTPPVGAMHIDTERIDHLHALLHAIRPTVAAPGVVPAAHACGAAPAAQQLDSDVAELGRRLDELSAPPSPFLADHYRLDMAAWLSRAVQLPGGCARAADTLGALLWADRVRRLERRILTRLDWRERTGEARWQAGDAAHVTVQPQRFARANPWRDPAGCVLLTEHHAAATAGQPRPNRIVHGAGLGWLTACRALVDRHDEPAASPLDTGSRGVPRDLALLAADLNAWRDPASGVYRTLVGDANRLRPPGGRPKPVGLHAWFTFDPGLQRIAQAIAECYAGENTACREMGIPDPGSGMRDGARVRQVGIAVIDIPSGEVRVAASAESPCLRHDLTGVGPRPSACPDLGGAARSHYRRDVDALRNHALFTVAPPGSTIKPIMAAGFFRDPGFKKSEAEFTERIRRSQSRIFLDWMFCRAGDGRGGFAAKCARPALIQSAAHALGWNAGCDAGEGCGRLDLLFGRPVHTAPAGFPRAAGAPAARFSPSARPVLLGRLLATGHGAGLENMSAAELQPAPARLAGCAKAQWDGGAGACRRPGLGAVSEGYGQGSAAATPLGVAALMAQLGASAAHGGAAPYPHVVRALLDAQGRPDPAGDPARWGTPTRPAGIDGAHARRILDAMTHSHRPGGTASGGCRKVFGADCGDIAVAGKTGTTSFGAEYTTLAGFRKAWQAHAARLAQYRSCVAAAQPGAARCRAPETPPPRPWRWYAGVFKSNPAAPDYDKAFAVLVERSWTTAERIDQEGGEAFNSPAIEIGFHLVAAARKARD